MAASQDILSSACPTHSSAQNENKSDQGDGLSLTTNLLVVCDNKYFWKGDYDELKDFTNRELHLTGKWLAPGGLVKSFSNDECGFKWYGPKSKKIAITKNVNGKLLDVIRKHAIDEIEANVNTAYAEHVEDAELTPLPSPTCDKCERHELDQTELEQKFEMILIRLNEIEEKQQRDERNATARISELQATMEAMKVENQKMADDLESKQITMDELVQDNSTLSQILEVKQQHWIKIEGENSTKKMKNATHQSVVNESFAPTTTTNRFTALDIEDSPEENQTPNSPEENQTPNNTTTSDTDDFKNQINSYRLRKQSNFRKQNLGENAQVLVNNHIKPNEKSKSTCKVLLLGDSMVKNIDNTKISRAAKETSCCKSYSGATVEQIHEKFQEEWCTGGDDERNYETIILHVGTNNLTHEKPEAVVTKMGKLIDEAKSQAKNVAVSSVVRRYDGLISNDKIAAYNDILHDMCLKHNITFIDNSTIDKPLLNRSNLHLNRNGDRALGKSLCDYLKSLRQNVASPGEPFFRVRQQSIEWTQYLNFVTRVLK